jgi:uncharacterized protein YaiE (UPF0345 family)
MILYEFSRESAHTTAGGSAMNARGRRSTAHLDSGALTIQHEGSVGWRETISATEIRIPVDSIVAIQLTKATPFTNGCLQFIVADERDLNRSHDATSVAFTYWQQSAFESLAREVARAIALRPSLAAVA